MDDSCDSLWRGPRALYHMYHHLRGKVVEDGDFHSYGFTFGLILFSEFILNNPTRVLRSSDILYEVKSPLSFP